MGYNGAEVLRDDVQRLSISTMEFTDGVEEVQHCVEFTDDVQRFATMSARRAACGTWAG